MKFESPPLLVWDVLPDLLVKRLFFTEITVAYTNIQSLPAKLNSLHLYVQQHAPACILITESWLSDNIPDSVIRIPGYGIYRSDRRGKRGGGACIYVRSSCFPGYKITHLDYVVHGLESLWLQFVRGSFSFTLATVYRTSDSSRASDEALIDLIEYLGVRHNNLVIAGDFNFSSINWQSLSTSDSTTSGAQFFNMVANSNLTQLIKEPTRFRQGQRPTLDDLLITNDDDLIAGIEMFPPIGCSDHVLFSFRIQTLCDGTPRNVRSTITRINYELLLPVLSNNSWQMLFGATSVENKWQIFCDDVRRSVQACSVSYSRRMNPRKPYLTQDFLARSRIKRSLWRRYKVTGSVDDYLRHRGFSNKLSFDIRSARSSYEGSLLDRGPKALHRYARNQISSRVSIPLVRGADGAVCESDESSAEVLASAFVSAFSAEPPGPIPRIVAPANTNSLDSVHFTEEIVMRELSALSTDTSPGSDLITAPILKLCASALAKPLSHIMEASFNQSSLPSLWRFATVTPIFKKGDKLDPGNYRPVSLVPICAKMMERVICKTMIDFLLESGVIPDTQHGFLPGRSTTTNLLYCLNHWTAALDRKQPVDIVYFDFARAFDRVPTRRLLQKLQHYGVGGLLLEWISAFLQDRNFSVRVGESFSTPQPVISGVPQGSVLGPLLFLVYTADLSSHIRSLHSFYADDTKIFGNPFDAACLQTDIARIERWSSDWLLPLNRDKCLVMHLGYNNPKMCYTFTDGQHLKTTETHVDLGVTVQSDLKWSEHVSSIVKKANSKCYIVGKAFQSSDKDLMSRLFKTLIRPILEYAGVVWNSSLIKDITLIESVQRRFTKRIAGLYNVEYDQRLSLVHLPSLADRRRRGDMIQTYRVLHNTFSVNLSSLFVLNLDERLRGHLYKLVRENFKSSAREHFFSNRIFHEWNSLPGHVVDAASINAFKNAYDEHLRG